MHNNNYIILCFYVNWQIQDSFEETAKPLEPIQLGNKELRREILDYLSIARSPYARELARIFKKPHFKVSTMINSDN